jgi:hypothetical protein
MPEKNKKNTGHNGSANVMFALQLNWRWLRSPPRNLSKASKQRELETGHFPAEFYLTFNLKSL